MASLYNKFLDFIGIEETDDIDDEDNYYRAEPPARRGNDNVVNFNNRSSAAPASAPARRAQHDRAQQHQAGGLPVSGGMKMIVYHPVSYEDTQNIIDNIKNRKPVIVNMEELEIECAQRILDFLSGAVYALNGTMSKISRGIFVVAPNNYDVVGNGEDEYDM